MRRDKQVKVAVCTNPYFLAACPKECLEEIPNLLPAELTESARRCRWVELSLRASARVISGVAMLGSCPTGLRATYLELYLGYFIPLLVKPDLQAVFRDGRLVSCRYGMQRLWLVDECRFKSVKRGVDPEEALRIYRRLHESKLVLSNMPLVLLYMLETDEIYVFIPGGKKFRITGNKCHPYP